MGDSPSRNKGEHKIVGQLASVRGSVVDIEFPEELPPIHSLIRTGENDGVMIEAAVHLDEQRVRGIALHVPAAHVRLGRADREEVGGTG